MLVLIWATLLFAVRSNNADTASSLGEIEPCQSGFCANLNQTELRAEAGLCVVIPCSFPNDPGFTWGSVIWYRCDSSKVNCNDSNEILHLNSTDANPQSDQLLIFTSGNKDQSGFRGRVSLLEPDVSQRNCSIIINDLTESDSGSYQLRVTGLNETMEGYTSPIVNITVKDLIQKPTVMIPPLTEGQQTTLTCTAPGLCSGSDPTITWTWRGAGEKDSHITGNITAFKTENLTAVTQRHSSTLTFNTSAEHHGTNVTCKVSFTGGKTTEDTVTLNVTLCPKILNSSVCNNKSEGLTCMCISEGFPLPTIKWPLLEKHTEYSVFITVSNHTVNSTMRLSVKDHSNTAVECVSSNRCGEVKRNLTNKADEDKAEEDKEEEEGQIMKLLRTVTRVEIIITFMIGVLLSVIFGCLVRACHRKKQRTHRSLTETLEMVTSHEHPVIDGGQAVEDDQVIYQEAAEGGVGAVAANKSDVEYSNLDFSMIKRKSAAEAETTQGTEDTEYAEIKKGEAGESREGEGKEEEEMTGEDEETKHCVTVEEKEGEDAALYSNVKDIMGQI